MNIPNTLLNSLIAHYESEKNEALAMVGLYLNNPVPVAEHSNILGELKNWTNRLSQAEENLLVLQKYIITPNQDN
jgi:hypothetical protein